MNFLPRLFVLLLPFGFTIHGVPARSASVSGLPIPDSLIASGLRQALEVGARNTAKQLSAVNGFFGDAAIKIDMPAEATKVESTLRRVGMGSLVDKAVLAMNRSAEEAAGVSVPIFVHAIRSMNIGDAVQILDGGNQAATDYLKKTTTGPLTTAFHPVIDSCLDNTNATKYWSDVFTAYNKIPFTKKVNTNLDDYVTSKALYGIFFYIGKEEQKIRQDPSAQVTGLLKSVFGSK